MSAPRNKKKIVTAGLVAGLLAGAGAGLVLEVSGSAGAEQSVTSAADTGTDAAAGSMDPAADHAAHLQSILQPLVDDGTLTQAQADAVIAALEAAGPMGDMHGDPDGDGMGGHHGGRDGGMGMGIEGLGPDAMSVVADTIGISDDDLRTALDGGQTIAEVATANGSSADAVIAALVDTVKAHIDGDVADLAEGERDREGLVPGDGLGHRRLPARAQSPVLSCH